eukprot:scaffold1117_cov167-Amphora_coffeaeformis.AAC.8
MKHTTPLIIALVAGSLLSAMAEGQFDPYQLNGGLVAGVAGQDFVVLAADTRLTGSSGFEILQRQHTSSRLWSMLPSNLARTMQSELKKYAERSASRVEAELDDYKEETVTLSSAPLKECPVWIGSVGCSTDCEQLKRVCQQLVRQNLCTGELAVSQADLSSSLALWLGQILYGRRGFPYYAFCVLAGCDAQGGHVYGYDAIGSYERLAVSVSGQGRNILQAILDRAFHTAPEPLNDDDFDGEHKHSLLVRRVTKTPTQVSETAEETCRILIQAFRDVAKREASVGDSVVLLCWKYSNEGIHPSITFASLPENRP